ncbi:MAG: hypothetical protein IPJ65_24875 [Archangiaceae bacterium]|nr:hypothetical protein [Archangiaceae bacterium]
MKNGGGTAANGVLPDPMPPALVASAAALARLNGAAPAAQNIAPGATATFVFHYLENGTGVGTLKFSAGARGVDAVSGAPLVGITTQSNTVSVLGPPVLAIEAVTPPLKLSRNQTFNVEVRVKNTGGTAATNVLPALSFAATGEALATVTPVAAQTIAAGGRGIFTIACRETGTGLGTLRARASATGLNPNFGTALTAAAMTAPAVSTVQEPAALSVVTFMLPASLSRGATFSLGMVVANTGQADAKSVVPTSATATVSGGTTATLVTGPTALTIPGGKTRTFTWQYRESGTAAGTLGFRAGATGADLNSNAALSAVAVSSNVTPVDVYLGCNGSALYPSLDGHLLDRDRSDLVPGSDRLRVKPYSALLNDFTRALGSQPASIRGQVATFDAYNPAAYGAMPPLAQPRWLEEQELAAISLYRVFIAAYQACVTLTASGTQYAAAPTAATATTECRSWQRRFWSATPGAAETTACASFAVSAENDGATPQLKWAATCATAATSMGFLAE